MFNVKDAAKAVALEARLKSLRETRGKIANGKRMNITVLDRDGYNPLALIDRRTIEEDADLRGVRQMLLRRYDNAIAQVKREFRQIDCAIPGEDANGAG